MFRMSSIFEGMNTKSRNEPCFRFPAALCATPTGADDERSETFTPLPTLG